MGHRLNEGDMPYEITDLSRVWVLADAYETDLARIKLGMTATLSLQAYPNKTFKGKVIFIDPILDAKTRTAKVRLEFANPKAELKPEMFGEVTLQSEKREGLRIPADAVIDSGTKKVVFVALDEGKFQPREIAGRFRQRRRGGGRLRARGRGQGRHPGELPHRLGVPPARLARRHGREVAMIQRIIRFSAENRFLVIAGTLVLLALQRLHDAEHPARRAARPLRHPGHRLLALGPQPRHHRGPGHLSHHDRAARRAEGEGHPRLLRLRVQLRLRHLRGRNRSLLGPDPGPRVPVQDHRAAAGRGEDRARARRHQRGLGLPVRARGPERPAQLRRAAFLPGLVPALRHPVRPGRVGGGDGGRAGPPVPDHRQPHQARRLQAAARGGHHRRAQGQQRRGRTARRALRPRVHGARPRLREVDRRPGEARPQGRGRHAHPGEGRRHRGARSGDPARRRRLQRGGGRGRAASW